MSPKTTAMSPAITVSPTTTMIPNTVMNPKTTTSPTAAMSPTTTTSPTATTSPTMTMSPTTMSPEMSRVALDGLRPERSRCVEILNSLKTAASNWPMDVEAGPYPCDGGSGQLLCATREGQTCHRFGGPWKYGAFAVREAIEHHLGNGSNCIPHCDGKAEAIRHVWEETQRNLLSIPPCPTPGFLDFTIRPSVPDLNDFEAMMRSRYPIVEECSGVCGECLEDTHTRKCSCSFVYAKCRIQAKGEKRPQVIELMDYNTQPGELFKHLSPFNNKLGLYDILGCRYECRQPGPDIKAISATGVDVRIVETEPTGDDSPLNSRLSRRELSSLQLPIELCRAYPEGGWRQLAEIGRCPCDGGSGVMMCKTTKHDCRARSSCGKDLAVSCHHFGPVWMDVFAVEDAVKHHIDRIKDCVVRCDDEDTMRHHFWEEANYALWNAPGYQRQTSLTSSSPKLLPKWYPAERSCSSTCNSDRQSCTNVPDCMCRVAHVKCETNFKNGHGEQELESWGFNTRMQNVLGMLSVPGANAKTTHPQTYYINTRNCNATCHGIMQSPK
ncbi:hypothetical protein GNI_104670 [Gregarina niphandrodes]|uniref:Uncharacterized protein n=1 Tax=Gregarina niphandrodes TaxID=110365 RepID=A0A023B458_GRENI|nr:hypothetical protein GNI_104670 [Gregarina niphandrodes]EZG56268.1 hypothetical protein GNI_104670 [Gregarina niphandrodes]|eukprot:XP_011131303.1 hypothetical protein GNI_104670 [Gregarina niphandrodes]